MTGGRIKLLKKHINEKFMLTYGDGLCDVNLKKLLRFHNTNRCIAIRGKIYPDALPTSTTTFAIKAATTK